MNIIKQILTIFVLAMGAAFPMSSFAQSMMDSGKMDLSQSASMTEGEVRKVDQEIGKITIRHGNIKHLDMPGMTMVFTAKDKNLLASVKPGDKVRFMVFNERGKLVVTDIQPVR